MIIAFIIWSVITLVFIVIGIISWRSEKPAGFFTGVKPPEVNDVVKYNHSVGTIWFVYAGLFEIFGVPFLFLKQNSAGFIIPMLGVVFSSIGLAVAYTFVLAKYQKKQ